MGAGESTPQHPHPHHHEQQWSSLAAEEKDTTSTTSSSLQGSHSNSAMQEEANKTSAPVTLNGTNGQSTNTMPISTSDMSKPASSDHALPVVASMACTKTEKTVSITTTTRTGTSVTATTSTTKATATRTSSVRRQILPVSPSASSMNGHINGDGLPSPTKDFYGWGDDDDVKAGEAESQQKEGKGAGGQAEADQGNGEHDDVNSDKQQAQDVSVASTAPAEQPPSNIDLPSTSTDNDNDNPSELHTPDMGQTDDRKEADQEENKGMNGHGGGDADFNDNDKPHGQAGPWQRVPLSRETTEITSNTTSSKGCDAKTATSTKKTVRIVHYDDNGMDIPQEESTSEADKVEAVEPTFIPVTGPMVLMTLVSLMFVRYHSYITITNTAGLISSVMDAQEEQQQQHQLQEQEHMGYAFVGLSVVACAIIMSCKTKTLRLSASLIRDGLTSKSKWRTLQILKGGLMCVYMLLLDIFLIYHLVRTLAFDDLIPRHELV